MFLCFEGERSLSALLPIPHHDTAIGNNGRKNTVSTVFNLIRTSQVTTDPEKASGKNGNKSTERGLDLQLQHVYMLAVRHCTAGSQPCSVSKQSGAAAARLPTTCAHALAALAVRKNGRT